MVLMMLHKQIGASYDVLEALFNKYMNCARVVVRNILGILIFGNGFIMSNLNVHFFFDVVMTES
jgi:hypothetical protein